MKRLTGMLLLLCLLLTILCGCGAAKSDKYVIIVMDEENAPVPGVTLELCTEELCNVLVTDETGTAEFEGDAGEYQVHVVKVPAGFAAPDGEYSMKKGGLLTLTLQTEN